MKIALDLSHINRDGGGISYVMRGMVRAVDSQPNHKFIYLVRDQADFFAAFKAAGGIKVPSNAELVEIPRPSILFGGGYTWYFLVARYLRRKDIDLLICFTLSPASLFSGRVVQIINDLSPLSQNFYFSFKERIQFRGLLNLTVIRSKYLFSISQATKDLLSNVFPNLKKSVGVFPLGLNAWVYKGIESVTDEDRAVARSEFGLNREYLLSVSTLQPRKNYLATISAFRKFLDENPELDFDYVIVGRKGWDYTKIFNLANQLGIEDRVKFLGYVPDRFMPAIFDMATAMIYTSLEEGFGLPIIEARANRLPVLCSNIPVFKEMELDNVIYTDQLSIDAMAAGMREVIKLDKTKPAKEFFEHYSWDNSWAALLDKLDRS